MWRLLAELKQPTEPRAGLSTRRSSLLHEGREEKTEEVLGYSSSFRRQLNGPQHIFSLVFRFALATYALCENNPNFIVDAAKT